MTDSDSNSSATNSDASHESGGSSKHAPSTASTICVSDLQAAIDGMKVVDYTDSIRSFPPSTEHLLLIKQSSARFGIVVAQAKKKSIMMSATMSTLFQRRRRRLVLIRLMDMQGLGHVASASKADVLFVAPLLPMERL
jgi:hypothetical protein